MWLPHRQSPDQDIVLGENKVFHKMSFLCDCNPLGWSTLFQLWPSQLRVFQMIPLFSISINFKYFQKPWNWSLFQCKNRTVQVSQTNCHRSWQLGNLTRRGAAVLSRKNQRSWRSRGWFELLDIRKLNLKFKSSVVCYQEGDKEVGEAEVDQQQVGCWVLQLLLGWAPSTTNSW